MGMLNFTLMLAAAALQVDAPGAALPVIAAPPPPPIYLPPTVSTAPANPHIPKPMGAVSGWVTTADYPKEALKAEQAGVVVANLTVAPTGRVSGCSVAISSGWPLLDAGTCKLLSARALFAPATDAAGNPVAGIFSKRVLWTIPGAVPYPVRPNWLDIRITIEADGTQSHCEITRTEGQLSVQMAHVGPIPCSGQKTRPYTDASGKAVRRIVTISQGVVVDGAIP